MRRGGASGGGGGPQAQPQPQPQHQHQHQPQHRLVHAPPLGSHRLPTHHPHGPPLPPPQHRGPHPHQHQHQIQHQHQHQHPHPHSQMGRDAPRILAGPMTQPAAGNVGIGMNMGLRIRRGPPPPPPQSQVPTMTPCCPCPPIQMHRPPPVHRQLQQAQMPVQIADAARPVLPMATASNMSQVTVLTSNPQLIPPATTLNNKYNHKNSTTPSEEESPKSDILSSEPTGKVGSSKEKTPMCLVNELARFNKIQHQYRLTSEQGPAHRRRFTVALRLGGGDKEHVEEYTAEAPRIRAAQHAVAAEALRCTSFPLPPPRPPKALRKQGSNGPDIIMPTVELNALVMKLGEPAIYKIEKNGPGYSIPTRPRIPLQPVGHNHHPILGAPPNHPVVPVAYNRNGRYYNQNNRFTYPYKYNNGYRDVNHIPSENFIRVELTVGNHIFHGKGVTLQAARNYVAAQALHELKQSNKETNEEKDPNQENGNDEKNCDDKSPVSMVHELALKFELPASFSVKNEKGPPHMKVFTTTCTVGELTTEGEGNSKKISKKRAAEHMLEKLKKIPSYKAQPKVQKPKRKTQPPKKKTRNLIKEKADTVVVSEQNPVSRLQQWANHRSGGGGIEPVYTLKVETNGQFRRNFVIECEIAGHLTTGTGTNKKIAKRNAAENMLIELGLGKTGSATTPTKTSPEITNEKQETSKSPRKVTFSLEGSRAVNNENIGPNTTGRQLVPGVLLMQDNMASVGGHYKTPTKNGVNIQTTAMIAKELLRAGKSPTAEALVKQDNHIGINANPKPISSSVVSSTTGGNQAQISQVIRPKDQLLYLAQLLGFQVQFSDFPKGNHGEFLSLVTLSTEPPMVCHGGGLTTEESHDQSARAALENLSQMGLDNVTPLNPVSSSLPGDGIRMISSNNGSISGILTNGISK